MKSTDSVIVSWDFSHGKDVGVLIGGKIFIPTRLELLRTLVARCIRLLRRNLSGQILAQNIF